MNSRIVLVLAIAGLLMASPPGATAADENARSSKDRKRAALVQKPNVQYPTEAKNARVTGSGIVLVASIPRAESPR